jgi:2',3'-cyclic-nucleotide 2'-phosphodiesterase (5'-nucleotidase family)
MKRFNLVVALLLGLLLTAAVPFAGARPERVDQTPVEVQLLTISDWHAQLEPISGVGGAAVLSSYFKADRAANPNTLTLTGGDAYGASPPISSFFNEEPAVKALRMMGLSADTFGNHNFDRGIHHLQRMVNLANARPGTVPGHPFRYVSANLRNLEQNLRGVAPWAMFNVGGIKVAVIGTTNEEAPTLVKPSSFGTIEVTDAAAATNRYARIARHQGAKVVVAITHKGVRGFDAAGHPFGELIDFAKALHNVDVIAGDHTDVQFSGLVNGILVVENRSKGQTYARVKLTVGPTRVTAKSAEFVVPTASGVTPDPAIQAMIDELKAQLAPILGTVIGQSSVEVTRADSCGRSDGRLCESLVGNTSTDAMRQTYGTDFAITNAGGLRNSLTCPPAGGGDGFCPAFTPPPWLITRGQVLAVLPFGNVVATLSVNGAELKTYLENGVSSMPGANGRFAQVSGLCFTYDVAAGAGSRVTLVNRQAADGTCTGGPVDVTSASTHTLAINDFMAAGGDGYPNVFSRVVTRELMDAVLADYVGANSPIGPSIQGRIVCTDSVAPNDCPVQTP